MISDGEIDEMCNDAPPAPTAAEYRTAFPGVPRPKRKSKKACKKTPARKEVKPDSECHRILSIRVILLPLTSQCIYGIYAAYGVFATYAENAVYVAYAVYVTYAV